MMRRVLLSLLAGAVLACTAAPPAVPPVAGVAEDSVPSLEASSALAAAAAPLPFAPLTANAFARTGDRGTGLAWAWRGASVVADPTVGTAVEFRYAAGRTGGTAPGNVWVDEPALRTRNAQAVHLTGRLWVSPNWQGHLTTTNKTLFVGFGLGGNQLIVNLKGKGAGVLVPSLYFQGMAALPGGTCGAGGCGGQFPGRVPFGRGAWHLVDLTVTASTAVLLVDGATVASVSGLQFTRSPFYLAKIALNPTWGGSGDRVLAPMQLRWADLRVEVAP